MSTQPSLFVTGTDTGVGKTHVAVELIRRNAARGLRVGAMKPVAAGWVAGQPGRNDDALALQAAATVPLPYELVNPFCLEHATSPHLAAARAGVSIDVPHIVKCFHEIRARCDVVIVEGAGGWLAPIHGRAARAAQVGTMQDVAVALALPVLLVVGVRLGCLSHALLTAAAVRGCGLELAGWYDNRIDADFGDAEAYAASLEAFFGAPSVSL